MWLSSATPRECTVSHESFFLLVSFFFLFVSLNLSLSGQLFE